MDSFEKNSNLSWRTGLQSCQQGAQVTQDTARVLLMFTVVAVCTLSHHPARAIGQVGHISCTQSIGAKFARNGHYDQDDDISRNANLVDPCLIHAAVPDIPFESRSRCFRLGGECVYSKRKWHLPPPPQRHELQHQPRRDGMHRRQFQTNSRPDVLGMLPFKRCDTPVPNRVA